MFSHQDKKKKKAEKTRLVANTRESEWDKAAFLDLQTSAVAKLQKGHRWLELILGDAMRTGQPAGPKMGLRHATTNK